MAGASLYGQADVPDAPDVPGAPAGGGLPYGLDRLSNPWTRFLTRRLARLLVSVFVVVTATFLMIHLIPGDPVRAALGLTAPADLVESRRESLGLNEPLITQYVSYLGGLFTGDLGTSMISGTPVSEIIADRLPQTALLGSLAFLTAVAIAVPLGLAMALLTRDGRRRGVELGFTSTAAVMSAIPEFLLGVALVAVFAVSLGWFPVAGMSGASSFVLPVLALALGPAMALARILRVEALRVLGEDYVRTARAKRLPRRLVYRRHVFPNALTSMLTIGGLVLGAMLIGTVLVENVFAWPGLGMTIVESILQKDYPLVQGVVLVYGTSVLFLNLAVDVVLGIADPRSTIRES
ncbi:ABC transporter permease [Actinobacteria bacterium YIM 96077]|uniref:ABC transporter permease n=1 Tax=Phytoactinopolyspora halophila TaxID=1981511 RepID=A0A329R1X9_9ACTN|nr:ABC transporter permease [Phytoactinopolyspora halophila]AYY12199.1 ABC transporter permease [Actinobacteria bacterium YIM 96077]RAW18567.1 ABC transporter permease [Phytoactinopolyspora halophila]